MIPATEGAIAAAVIRECRRDLAEAGNTLLREVLGGAATAAWRHYPEGEVYDRASHAQYFFHTHAAPQPGGEQGHFHLFLRAGGMPAGVTPLLLPELALANLATAPQAAPLKHGKRAEVSHLVAIALGADGEPIRLFTTNRWVTGETWYAAADVIRMLDRFVVGEAAPAARISRWLGALVRLFQPEIAALLRARDETVMGWRRRRRGNVFEDTRLEIGSSVNIDLEARLAAVEHGRERTPAPAMRTAPRLPPMADGWGI